MDFSLIITQKLCSSERACSYLTSSKMEMKAMICCVV